MRDKEAGGSAISQVEVLGYPRLSLDGKHYLEACFFNIIIYPVDSRVTGLWQILKFAAVEWLKPLLFR